MKKVFAAVIVFAVIGAGISVYLVSRPEKIPEPVVLEQPAETPEPNRKVIGSSVEGRAIEAHAYGEGSVRLLFIGGIHGGYEWNSVLLAYRFIDYLESNPNAVPKGTSVAVIPSDNPDGVYKVIGKEGSFTLADVPADSGADGKGRFNANNVDLNRNFDCKWKPKSTWRGNVVSAGTAAFSEPEARAIRDFVKEYRSEERRVGKECRSRWSPYH